MAIQGRGGAQLPTLIGSALAYIAMGRTHTVPLDRIAWHTVSMHAGSPGSCPAWARITA